MTNQHPLTDELLQQIGCSNQRARVFDTQAMRTAYDKSRDEQLKDDMKWLKENLGEWLAYEDLWDMKTKIGIGMFINDLKKAMRPQEDNS